MNALVTETTSASAPGARARPYWRKVLAQTRAELTMTLRRGESVLITIIVPPLLLVFFTLLNVVPSPKPVNYLLPSILALAIISTGMVSLGIATAFERYYGVLKRLGSSPLPRSGLLLAKSASVLVLEIGQTVLLLALAVGLYGWRPAGSFWAALLAFLLGSACFAGLGMLMAGALRAEATLAGANGLYLLFLLIPGTILPLDHLVGWLQGPASLLPAAALAESLRGAMTAGAHVPWGSLAALAVWAVIFLGAAARTFQWE
jgi:ABC-2 type transport system permease protein